jgi:hypothetical protein
MPNDGRRARTFDPDADPEEYEDDEEEDDEEEEEEEEEDPDGDTWYVAVPAC